MTDPNLTEHIAKFIREKRMARGESTREFAEFVFGNRAKQSWICDIENQKKSITLKTLNHIFKKLSCDISIIEY